MFNYSVNDFEIVRFFSYTSTIQYGSVIAEVDMNNFRMYPNICDHFDNFYDQLVDEAVRLTKEKFGTDIMYFTFRDNKTVFQLKHKSTGQTIFIGRYDARRAIGTSCMLFDGRIFDFTTMKLSGYISDVRCDGRWLWKKYELN